MSAVVLKCWSCKADVSLAERSDCDGCCWKCGSELGLESYLCEMYSRVKQLEIVVTNTKNSLEKENERGSIIDTLWMDSGGSETVFDYLDRALIVPR